MPRPRCPSMVLLVVGEEMVAPAAVPDTWVASAVLAVLVATALVMSLAAAQAETEETAEPGG